MKQYLYKMQIAGYDRREYWRLVPKPTVGTPQMTARLRRLRVVSWTLCLLGLGLPWLCSARTVAAAHWLLQPYERYVQRKWLRRAQRKMARCPGLIKIGITGSYGKTSVKNLLVAMLSSRYRVVASPHSFNTPMGFARTVNEFLQLDTQILIMEMGARHPHDIQEMCDLVHPDHAIITSIGPCHLQTLGDIATVARTKAALFRNLPPQGIAVTDGDNPWCAQLTHPGLRLVTAATMPVYQTNLLGEHNQKNIGLAATMAMALGIDEITIRQVVATMPPPPHRLQRLVAPNGIIILDDSYNANPQSAVSALKVLAAMPGRKVVQTPGFVEQGNYTAVAHAELCTQIKAVADAVIVVGAVNRADLQAGLTGWEKPVHYVPNRDAAKPLYAQLLQAGDVLLLLNDLPEQY